MSVNIDSPCAKMLIEQHKYLQWKLSDDVSATGLKKHERKLFWEKLAIISMTTLSTAAAVRSAYAR